MDRIEIEGWALEVGEHSIKVSRKDNERVTWYKSKNRKSVTVGFDKRIFKSKDCAEETK